MLFFRLSIISAVLVLLLGCQSSEVKLNSIGKESELLIICDDDLYKTDAVKAIIAVLTNDYPALPQQESLFDVIRINESGFSELFRRHKSILKIEVSSEETKLTVKRNEYANQQAVLQLKINKQQLNDTLSGHRLGLSAADFFSKEDRKLRINKLNKAYSKKISEIAIRNFGFKISVPEDFFIARDDNNCLWLRRETSNTTSSILIYSIPANADMNPVLVRDSITKVHIPGPSEGSFMIINKEFEPVVYSDSLLNHPATITRGIWKMENDFMGGPFVNFCFTDTIQKRTLFIDAFVYAPKFDKRDYINRLMAIIYSAEVLH